MTEEISKSTANKIGKTFDSILGPINQRLSNPYLGSFILSWCIVNWKPIVFLIFSKETIEKKIKYVSANFYGQGWENPYNWFLYLIIPILFTIFYALCLPRIENVFEKLNSPVLKTKKRRIHEVNIDSYNERITYAELQAKMEDAKTNYKSLEEKNKVISDLGAENLLLKKQIDIEKTNSSSLRKELSESEKRSNEYLLLTSEAKNKYTEGRLSFENYFIETSKMFERIARYISHDSREDFEKIIKDFKNSGQLSVEQKNSVIKSIENGLKHSNISTSLYAINIKGNVKALNSFQLIKLFSGFFKSVKVSIDNEYELEFEVIADNDFDFDIIREFLRMIRNDIKVDIDLAF